MLPKGILFDLDDTVLAFDLVADDAWQRVCEEHAGDTAPRSAREVRQAIDDARRWWWSDPVRNKMGRMRLDAARREIVARAFECLGIDNLPLAHKVADTYSVVREELIQFLPGAEQTLQELRNRNIALALLTNGEAAKQRAKVERFRLGRFFRSILIEGEIGVGKPDEAIFHRALSDLGLTASEVWCVGDNLEWDIAGAQRLGIFAIWNDYTRSGLPAGSSIVPDRIVHSIAELVA